MMQKYRRTEKNYDGCRPTSHHLKELASGVLCRIGETHRERPDLILAAWPDIIGSKLAMMTQAVSCIEGVLLVKVRNSTLHSLLSQRDKAKLLASLRQKFPGAAIKNIVFHIG